MNNPTHIEQTHHVLMAYKASLKFHEPFSSFFFVQAAAAKARLDFLQREDPDLAVALSSSPEFKPLYDLVAQLQLYSDLLSDKGGFNEILKLEIDATVRALHKLL